MTEPLIDKQLRAAREQGLTPVIMAAPDALPDLRNNTPESEWTQDGNTLRYRGALVEIHDEWSWGWLLRSSVPPYKIPA